MAAARKGRELKPGDRDYDYMAALAPPPRPAGSRVRVTALSPPGSDLEDATHVRARHVAADTPAEDLDPLPDATADEMARWLRECGRLLDMDGLDRLVRNLGRTGSATPRPVPEPNHDFKDSADLPVVVRLSPYEVDMLRAFAELLLWMYRRDVELYGVLFGYALRLSWRRIGRRVRLSHTQVGRLIPVAIGMAVEWENARRKNLR